MLFILALFGVFMVCALFVVLFGANIYKNTVADMQLNFNKRTAVSYVSEKIRRHDMVGAVSIKDKDGGSELVLKEEVDGDVYLTHLYAFDGSLKEITVKEGTDFDPGSGQDILKVSEFNAEKVSDSLYRFDIRDDKGQNTDFFVAVYSETDGGYELE